MKKLVGFKADERILDLMSKFCKENKVTRTDLIKDSVIDCMSRGNFKEKYVKDVNKIRRKIDYDKKLGDIKEVNHYLYAAKNVLIRIIDYSRTSILLTGKVDMGVVKLQQKDFKGLLKFMPPNIVKKLRFQIDEILSITPEKIESMCWKDKEDNKKIEQQVIDIKKVNEKKIEDDTKGVF